MENIIIFSVGIISGFLGATVGGGGLFVLPVLMIAGMPPQTAVATKKAGDVGTFLAAIKEYWGGKKINVKFAVILSCFALASSLVGAKIMLGLSADILKNTIGIIILLLLPTLYLNGEAGIKARERTPGKTILALILYFIVGVVGAATGVGSLTLIIFIMIYLLGFKVIDGYATNSIAQLILAAVPAAVYFFYGLINIFFALLLFIGGIIGSELGARTAMRKGNKWVKHLFFIIVLVSVIKILF